MDRTIFGQDVSKFIKEHQFKYFRKKSTNITVDKIVSVLVGKAVRMI